MSNTTLKQLVNSTKVRSMDWRQITYGSLIYTESKWYLYLDRNRMIRVEHGHNWAFDGLKQGTDQVQVLCDECDEPISFFYEFQQMLLELLSTGRSF